MSTQAELFTKDLENFHTEQKHYLDASGNFLGYNPTDSLKLLHTEEQKKLIFDDRTMFKGYGKITDPTCMMEDPTLKGGYPLGLSNVNFGRIGNSLEIGGKNLEDLGLEWRVLKGTEAKIAVLDAVEAQDEQGSEEETQWHCKGCAKYFATKASLKRHHERKKSCKEICEKPIASEAAVPDKPYIVDWIDGLLIKAISGESDKPYCKHCDVEFANKTNLNKHLTKSVACDKLAKQEFVKFIQSN